MHPAKSMALAVALALCIVLFFCFMAARYAEKKSYNNGIGPHCGDYFEHFDTDSQGGRGYICRRCGYTTWISYNVDSRK